jgi:hypothetical protein
MSYAISEEEFRKRVAEYNRESTNGAKPAAEVLSMHTGARLDTEPHAKPRLRLIPFDEIKLGTESRYLVKGIIPRIGLVIVWGPPKCGKKYRTVHPYTPNPYPYRTRTVHP